MGSLIRHLMETRLVDLSALTDAATPTPNPSREIGFRGNFLLYDLSFPSYRLGEDFSYKWEIPHANFGRFLPVPSGVTSIGQSVQCSSKSFRKFAVISAGGHSLAPIYWRKRNITNNLRNSTRAAQTARAIGIGFFKLKKQAIPNLLSRHFHILQSVPELLVINPCNAHETNE